jgi:hypothetical protein
VKYRQPGNRSGERHIEPPEPVRLTRRDLARLDQDHVVELQALGQRDRDQREPVRARGLAHAVRAQDAEFQSFSGQRLGDG